MLISSIVIAISYYVLFLVNNRFKTFHAKSNYISEYRLFCKTLQVDVEEAKAITGRNEENGLNFQFEQKTSTDYMFYDSNIVRLQGSSIDTFHLVNWMRSRSNLNDSIKLISSFKLDILLEKELLPLVINKRYTSKELMNYYYKIFDEQYIY